jgi:hypothetical protein
MTIGGEGRDLERRGVKKEGKGGSRREGKAD